MYCLKYRVTKINDIIAKVLIQPVYRNTIQSPTKNTQQYSRCITLRGEGVMGFSWPMICWLDFFHCDLWVALYFLCDPWLIYSLKMDLATHYHIRLFNIASLSILELWPWFCDHTNSQLVWMPSDFWKWKMASLNILVIEPFDLGDVTLTLKCLPINSQFVPPHFKPTFFIIHPSRISCLCL